MTMKRQPTPTRVVTKYIEAVSGANFGIECQVLPGYDFEADYLSFAIFFGR
jgi:hypothetical protein